MPQIIEHVEIWFARPPWVQTALALGALLLAGCFPNVEPGLGKQVVPGQVEGVMALWPLQGPPDTVLFTRKGTTSSNPPSTSELKVSSVRDLWGVPLAGGTPLLIARDPFQVAVGPAGELLATEVRGGFLPALVRALPTAGVVERFEGFLLAAVDAAAQRVFAIQGDRVCILPAVGATSATVVPGTCWTGVSQMRPTAQGPVASWQNALVHWQPNRVDPVVIDDNISAVILTGAGGTVLYRKVGPSAICPACASSLRVYETTSNSTFELPEESENGAFDFDAEGTVAYLKHGPGADGVLVVFNWRTRVESSTALPGLFRDETSWGDLGSQHIVARKTADGTRQFWVLSQRGTYVVAGSTLAFVPRYAFVGLQTLSSGRSPRDATPPSFPGGAFWVCSEEILEGLSRSSVSGLFLCSADSPGAPPILRLDTGGLSPAEISAEVENRFIIISLAEKGASNRPRSTYVWRPSVPGQAPQPIGTHAHAPLARNGRVVGVTNVGNNVGELILWDLNTGARQTLAPSVLEWRVEQDAAGPLLNSGSHIAYVVANVAAGPLDGLWVGRLP